MPRRSWDQLPDWPAVMPEEMAAVYVGLSPTTFRKKIIPQIPPKQLTEKRIGWRRADLDAWVAQRDGNVATLEVVNSWDLSLARQRHNNGKKTAR